MTKIQWVCPDPKCSELVLEYVGSNEDGPETNSVVRLKDWKSLQSDKNVFRDPRGPLCKCGSGLRAMSRYLIKTDERANNLTLELIQQN